MSLSTIVSIAQIIVAIVVIGLVLLQERGSGAGGLFGGGGGGEGFYQTRRGIEKTIFAATIVFVAVFALLALANLFVK